MPRRGLHAPVFIRSMPGAPRRTPSPIRTKRFLDNPRFGIGLTRRQQRSDVSCENYRICEACSQQYRICGGLSQQYRTRRPGKLTSKSFAFQNLFVMKTFLNSIVSAHGPIVSTKAVLLKLSLFDT